MPDSRPSDPDPRTAILAAFARWQGHHGDRYVAYGPWRVTARQLALPAALPRLIRPRVPGLGPKVMANLLANRSLRGVEHLPIENDAVQLADAGTRVRSFDHGRDVSRKLVVRQSKYGAGAERDLQVRRDLLPRASVRHPRVWASDHDAVHVFIEEELVRGRRFAPYLDFRHVDSALVDPLSRLYETAGLRAMPVTEAIGAQVAEQILGLAADTPVVRHAQAILRADPQIAAGYGHGDLLPSNLAVDRDGVVFLDWETAGYAPVGFDLLRLWRKYPRTKAFLTGAGTLIRRHQDRALDLPDTASLQLAIGLLTAAPKRTRAALQIWPRLDRAGG